MSQILNEEEFSEHFETFDSEQKIAAEKICNENLETTSKKLTTVFHKKLETPCNKKN